jgi:hypothetical protein
MAQSPHSDATATVRGVWNTGNLTVGGAGEADLFVRGTQLTTSQGINLSSVGALSSTMGAIGAQPGSSGNVEIAGLAIVGFTLLTSEWNITDNLALGGSNELAGGDGRLAIAPFNTVAVGAELKMWPGGTLTQSKDGIFMISGMATLGGTLEFLLPEGFRPRLNDTYQILTAGSVLGTFNSTILPDLESGLSWTVEYTSTSVSLKVIEGVPGDYNEDGTISAADYVVWRNSLGQTGAGLPADGNGDNAVDSADYGVWRAHFGQATNSAGRSAQFPASRVPEPATLGLGAIAAVGVSCLSRRSGRADTAKRY